VGFSEQDLERMVTHVGRRLLGIRGQLQTKIKSYLRMASGEHGSLYFSQPSSLHPLLAVALSEHLKAETEVQEIINYLFDFNLPTNRTVEVGYGREVLAVVEGYYFFLHKSTPLVAHIFVDYWPVKNPSAVSLYFNPQDQATAERFIQGLEEHFYKRNFYKGQKLVLVKVGNQDVELRFLDAEGWKGMEVVLPEGQHQAIYENTLGWLQQAEALSRAGLATKRGVILSGPPGTGKTLLFKSLCAQAEGITCLFATGESFVSPGDILNLYELARMLKPTMVFLEDLDFVGNERQPEGTFSNKLLGALLAELDGVKGNEEIVTLASTNFPEVIDKALADRPGRFDLKVEITFPGKEERKRMLSHFLGRLRDGVRPEVSEEEIASLVEATNGLSGAHLAEVVTQAASRCLFDRKPVLTPVDLRNSLKALKEGKEKEIGF